MWMDIVNLLKGVSHILHNQIPLAMECHGCLSGMVMRSMHWKTSYYVVRAGSRWSMSNRAVTEGLVWGRLDHCWDWKRPVEGDWKMLRGQRGVLGEKAGWGGGGVGRGLNLCPNSQMPSIISRLHWDPQTTGLGSVRALRLVSNGFW